MGFGEGKSHHGKIRCWEVPKGTGRVAPHCRCCSPKEGGTGVEQEVETRGGAGKAVQRGIIVVRVGTVGWYTGTGGIRGSPIRERRPSDIGTGSRRLGTLGKGR